MRSPLLPSIFAIRRLSAPLPGTMAGPLFPPCKEIVPGVRFQARLRRIAGVACLASGGQYGLDFFEEIYFRVSRKRNDQKSGNAGFQHLLF